MSVLDNVDTLNIKLRDYQLEMIEAIDECENNTILSVMPTGTGKTFTIGAYCLLTQQRILWIVCSEELIYQTYDSFKALMPDIDVGIFIGNHKSFNNKITIASLQTIKNPNNLILLDDDYVNIVFDEAHHSETPTAKRIFYRYGMVDLDTAGFNNVRFFNPHFLENRKLIGCTATPDRTDGTPLGNIFQDRVDSPSLEWFISEGYLCDLKFISVETGIDLSDVRTYIGDLSEGDIAQKLIDSGYINELGRVIETYCADRKSILLYLPNVATAITASKLLNEAGISSDYVVGSERKRRKEVIKRFKRGEIRVLVNCLVLKEGFDAPVADCAVICRPTKSALLLTQFIGRVTRNAPGKEFASVIDLVFGRRQQDIITASSIFEDYDLKDPEIVGLSIKQRYELQIRRANLIQHLTHIIDRYRHNKDLSETKELEEKIKKSRYPKDPQYIDMPDSIQLLVDTRILKKLDVTYKEFMIEFKNEVYNLTANQKSIFQHTEVGDSQLDKLQELTGYNREDLSIMDWVDAQALIGVFNAQKPTSTSQTKFLNWLMSKKGIAQEEIYKAIPKTSKKANDLIKEMTGVKSRKRRVRRGRA